MHSTYEVRGALLLMNGVSGLLIVVGEQQTEQISRVELEWKHGEERWREKNDKSVEAYISLIER